MSKNGLHLITPTSIASTGTGNSSSINTNGSVTFSTCETLSLNGVFSADYDNYMIVWRGTGNTAATIGMRFRASGTDNTTANSYVEQNISANGTSVGGLRTTTTSAGIGVFYNTQRTGFVAWVYGPFIQQPTAYRSVTASDASSAYLVDYAATHNQSTSYDGFTLTPAGANMSGLLCVYGMRK